MNYNNIRTFATTTLVPLALISPFATASASDWFASAGLKENRVSITNKEFSSYGITASGGYWLKPGVGVQAAIDLPVDQATSGQLSVKLNSLISTGLRLESQTLRSSGVATHFSFGAALAAIDAVSTLSAEKSTFTGHYVSGGLTFALGNKSQLIFDYSHYVVDSDVKIPSFQISYRQRFSL